MGTREALCCMQLLGEKCRDMNTNLLIFARVKHDKFLVILETKLLDILPQTKGNN